MPAFDEILFTQRQEVWSQQTRNPMRSYDENPESLSHMGFVWYRVVTDGQTDRQTDRQNYES